MHGEPREKLGVTMVVLEMESRTPIYWGRNAWAASPDAGSFTEPAAYAECESAAAARWVSLLASIGSIITRGLRRMRIRGCCSLGFVAGFDRQHHHPRRHACIAGSAVKDGSNGCEFRMVMAAYSVGFCRRQDWRSDTGSGGSDGR
ncbi:hypothetical protein ACLOJK_004711 [Asimina triloba]